MPTQTVLRFIQFLFILLIIFFSSAILASRLVQRGEMVTVPDLVGKNWAEAKAELIKRKLAGQEKAVEFSDRYEKGRVIGQDPSAGSKIRVNRAVKLTLSAGSEMVVVPKLVGQSLESASRTLSEAGLQRGQVSQIHTPQYAAGRIIAQEPPPSEVKISRSTPINFLVSQGEIELKYIMPDLIGRNAIPTIARLTALGFKVGDVRYSYYPGRDSGIIIKQFPPGGYAIAKRNLITLEVSR
jgi:beta-lactam-binding protein with PASTA domain